MNRPNGYFILHYNQLNLNPTQNFSFMTTHPIDFQLLRPQPLLIILSGLSGVGKDTVIHHLLNRDLLLEFVVTTTSRPPRAGEKEGVDYHFVSKAQFEEMITKNELIEYAQVYEDYKGPQRKHVQKALDSGKDVIMRLDVQGAARIRKLNPEAVLIFLTPLDEKEWYERLKKRGTETEESFRIRIDTAENELKYLPIFDYVVLNANRQIEKAVDAIEAIIKVEHMRVIPRKINL
jgi:guanylate kinase